MKKAVRHHKTVHRLKKAVRHHKTVHRFSQYQLLILIGGICGIFFIATPQPLFARQIAQSSSMSSSMTAEDYFLRASKKQDDGDYQGAIADYTQAIKLKPDYADAYYNRGLLYQEMRNKQSAIVDLQKAAELYQQQNNAQGHQKVLDQLQGLQP